MLHHRSFKPAKCKTALKLAVSRIKLLRNQREGRVKKLRRELGQLLSSGHNLKARVQVEHLVTEEKMMAAYDLIEIYCELIAARLPMIQSQRNCPIDSKEAISSVIFASPRCLEIPELVDVRMHIMAKYGRQFVSAAVELRPDCGVNRLLVEKLSTKAADGPTKIKILTAIAEEHNVMWQPSLEENDMKSSQDLLAGANTFDKTTYVEPPQLYVPPAGAEKDPPNLRASYQLTEMHDISMNSYDQNASLASSGTEIQEMNFKDIYLKNTSVFQMGRQSWSMEFKDAASAAHAAAESAERASMAARAAAGLSNLEKLTRQYSSGWHSSSGSGLEGVNKASKIPGAGLGWKPSRVSYEIKDQKATSMDNWASSEHGSSEHAASKPSSEPKRFSSEETVVTSSARVQTSISLPKTTITDKEEASKSLNSNKDVPTKEKASQCSHVHPKLPDYDTFAAQFLSLKKGHL
ncbi:uncharacterized protein LOC113855770 [Abrus precatorius]|uniref:Uncharacterized protein LOC113855770 n=1 Tax=Abrus precatorius TaxID=3816 RepID=A0A8B8KK27_ABRPR|nr:uncharacterized protein LOC113855770 [Abrus precatorius]